MLTAEQLRKLLVYDPQTGHFHWLPRMGRKRACVVAGKKTGTLRRNGYVQITIGRKYYAAHRLAWLYMTGNWPAEQIDHENRVKNDNRWVNLRAATRQENSRNRNPKHNSISQLLGVTWVKTKGRWRATIHTDGRIQSLGEYPPREEAHAVYLAEAKRRFGEFAYKIDTPSGPRL